MANGLLLREKALGCLLGVYIGDALGAPWECRTRDEILALAGGRVERYFPASATHKFLPNWPAGKGTDDTDFTDAIVRAYIITKGQFNMDEIARQHVLAFERSSAGCGKGSKAAIERLQAGVHWSESAVVAPGVGAGNGVAMKIAPLGLVGASMMLGKPQMCVDTLQVKQLARMTHSTFIGEGTGAAQAFAVQTCANQTPDAFRPNAMIRVMFIGIGQQCFSHPDLALFMQRLRWLAGTPPTPPPEQDDLIGTWRLDWRDDYGAMTDDQILEHCGSGGFLAHESLPFSYAYFLRNPHSIDALYDVITAGGDADTNGSMVGSLLGALHGRSIFPKHLVDGLVNRDALMERAEAFCDVIGL